GAIRDRYGRVLAQDVPCYNLAIDYRAMNMDDRWIEDVAVTRLKAAGIRDRRERLAQLPNAKAQVASQIENIPELLARLCSLPGEQAGVSPEELTRQRLEIIRERYESIRERMDVLRQTQWTIRRYDRATDAQNIASGLMDPDASVKLREDFAAHTIVPAVPDSAVFQLDKELDNYPGLKRIDAKHRVYPYGRVAAHVIGVLRPVSKPEYTGSLPHFDRPDLLNDEPGNLRGYLPSDDIGAFGVEAMSEKTLRGSRGVRLVEVGGSEVQEQRQNPAPGQDVRLTLDVELQKQLTDAFLDPKRNLLKAQDPTDPTDHQVALVILAMDGQVLALITTPTNDLNTYREHIREWLVDETNRPLLNRTVASVYPPGSIVKPLVAAAALMENVTNPQESVVCRGYLFPNQPHMFRCSIYSETGNTHGPMHLETALEASCNIYFYTMGGRLGLERLTHWFSDFGLGAETGIGLGEETSGSLPHSTQLSDVDLARREAIFLGIGQGAISTTPLQMANAYATLLRGGMSITPRLLLDAPMKHEQRFTLTPEAQATIRRGMELVVAGDQGTARKVLRTRISIAGKTGSATARRYVIAPDGTRTVKQDSDAWFVGYVPADRPRFVIAALKEFGGHGGTSAAPLVKEAVLALERLGYLPKLD
ncbi:MAG: penicillin-binding transpeptidase domain-containing protein, partial [Phycisphaerae bacterium]